MRTSMRLAGVLAVSTIAAAGAVVPAAQAAQVSTVAPAATGGPACTQPLLAAPSRPSLKASARGAETVASLGSSLPAAAARNAMAPARLTEILTHDKTSRLDACGRMFYLDEPVTQAATTAAALPAAPGTLSASGDAFALSSRPGSRRTIYLDFDGSTLTDTAWNTSYAVPNGFALAPYDTDGFPATFSTVEQDAIREIWLRVSEDYAPFDVNVTTALPAPGALDRVTSSDLDYGVTAAITNDTTIMSQCGCGGVAYLNVFGITGTSHEKYQPALVFANNLGAGTAKYVAEATTHEVGHNFGLAHDGVTGGASYYTGQGAWAPIMGVGYYQPLVQWSKGEYANANNTEDDIAKIAVNAPIMADDHANVPGSATTLVSAAWVNGLVSTSSDSDWFTFSTGGGSTTVTLTPQTAGGNLDSRLDIVAADGTTVLATANPAVPEPSTSRFITTGLNASATLSLPAGTYYAKVTGTGQGSASLTGYSAYDSLGRYQIGFSTDSFGALAVSTSTVPVGTVGASYSTQLAASGGSGSSTWSLTSGALPAGLSLSTAGVISGIPTTTGGSTFSVTASDSAASMTAIATYTITVSQPLAVTTSSLPGAVAGTAYGATLASSGGSGTTAWSLASGSLPAGVTLSTGGVLSGTPTTVATASFTVAVTDADGRRSTKALSIAVAAPVTSPLTISTSTLPNATRNVKYSVTLASTGGYGTKTWTRVSGSLPSGLSLSTSGVISGKATKTGTWSFTIRVTDGAGSTASRSFSLRVA